LAQAVSDQATWFTPICLEEVATFCVGVARMSFGSFLRPICAKLTGKQIYEEQDRMLVEYDTPLVKQDSYIMFLGSDWYTVQADRVSGPGATLDGKFELEAVTTPPVEFSLMVPEDHLEGRTLRVSGPHGPIEVTPPPGSQPGQTLKWRLGPKPEFKVVVPPGAGPGSQAKFKRSDGAEIMVQVPPGYATGDVFDVCPPALMVRVPDGAQPGDFVCFRHSVSQANDNMEVTEWCRACVPKGVETGKYFAAKLPGPGLPAPKMPKPGMGTE